ncbi:MAG: sensor histidine kinase [Bacillota bacterium]
MKQPSFYGKRRYSIAFKYLLCFIPLGLYLLIQRDRADYVAAVLLLLSALAACCILFFSARRERRMLGGLQKIADAAESGFAAELSTLDEGMLGAVQHALCKIVNEARHTIASGAAQKEYMQEFVSHISHQMKTPIASISMYHELMQDNPEMPRADAERFLHRSQEQLKRLEWLISTLLQIARLEADSIVMEMRPQSLISTLHSAMKTFEEIAAQKGIALNLDAGEDYPLPHDEKWLTQAFENLIKNAIEHTDAGGTVGIQTGQNNFYVWVKIADNGAGMDEEKIKHIFDAFYSHREDDSVGAGLGLALVKSIIKRHGGEIYVKSKKGVGTRFEITFDKSRAS